MRILAAMGPGNSPTLPGTSHPLRVAGLVLCALGVHLRRPFSDSCVQPSAPRSVVRAGRGAVWVCTQKVCVPLCLCVQAGVHACVPCAGLHVAVCTHVSPCTRASMYMCVRVHVCPCTCVCTRASVYVYTRAFLCTCVHVHLCVCLGVPRRALGWRPGRRSGLSWGLYGPLSVKVGPGPLPSPSAQGSILRAGKRRLPCPSRPLRGSWAGCPQWAG